MRIFISWSGEKSKKVALLLEDWIKSVIQAARPWVSTNIESGSSWLNELNEQLSNVNLGIVCITAENKNSPWLLFEAGALAKGLSTSRVCPLLIDLNNDEITQPLAQFNHTSPDKTGMRKLITTINNQLGDNALPYSIIDKVFEKYWPDFDQEFNIISKMPVQKDELSVGIPKQEILSEILNSVRSFEKRLTNIERPTTRNENSRSWSTANQTAAKPFISLSDFENLTLSEITEKVVSRFPDVSDIERNIIVNTILNNLKKS